MHNVEKYFNNSYKSEVIVNKNEIRGTHKYILFGYCFIISLVFLLICTRTSPLYPFNNWVDPNAFFTMGKGMVNGKILYRDLFEQKGPLLYLIHGLSYLISNTTFLGVFIFEVISFSFFLFYCYKLIALFIDDKYSIISLPLITAVILNMENFTYGDSAEEFCLPLITISLYYLINYFKNIYPDTASNKCLLINGIIAGCVLWIKFSLLGFWFGWMASIFICMVAKKNYLNGIKGCFVFLFGMTLATLPWIFYFGINNSIIPWLESYFYINAISYPVDVSWLKKLVYVICIFNLSAARNFIFAILFYFGMIVFLYSNDFIKHILHKICFFLCIFFLSLGVYGGGRGYIYYFLIFSPFVLFGLIKMLELLKIKFDNKITFRASILISIISLIFTFSLTFLLNDNSDMLMSKRQELVQYRYASIINQTKDATLLNYGYLDHGFYTAANITPNVRFFENQNIDYSRFPLIMDEQNRYIKDKEIDYVVIRIELSEDEEGLQIPYLYDNYNLIKNDTQVYKGEVYKYLLFKIK